MDLIKELEAQQLKQEKPEVNVGDTVRVHVKIKEGSRERIQVFEGIVIAKRHGGLEETITVAPSYSTCATASVRQPRFVKSCKSDNLRAKKRSERCAFFVVFF